jgi:hypothetical protein
MPEYKLMVKDDTFQESMIEESINKFEEDNKDSYKPLQYK